MDFSITQWVEKILQGSSSPQISRIGELYNDTRRYAQIPAAHDTPRIPWHAACIPSDHLHIISGGFFRNWHAACIPFLRKTKSKTDLNLDVPSHFQSTGPFVAYALFVHYKYHGPSVTLHNGPLSFSFGAYLSTTVAQPLA